jgi:VWA domain-containing protein
MKSMALLGSVIASLVLSGGGAASAQTNVMFVFDASGSMKKDAGGGESRMVVAKRAIGETLRSLPASARLGLMVYGHRRSKDCSDIELVSPIASEDAAALARYVGALDAKGETPIAEALVKAGRSFAAFKGQSNRIVLVTDGIEECRGDPCDAARQLAALGLDLKVDVVGFTLNDAQRKLIQCVPDVTGGQYHEARDTRGLKSALAEVQKSVSAPPPAPLPPPQRQSLIAEKNGGSLLIAPNNHWKAAIDDKEALVAPFDLTVGQQGVFGFRDDRPAKFDTFAVLVNSARGRNVKEIELLAGDEGPTGQFRSIAKCTFENAKMLRTPYQECKFAPVTARLLKVRVASNYGDFNYFSLEEWQLYGELTDLTPVAATPAPQPTARINLIAEKNGGSLLIAPNNHWKATIDDKEALVAPFDLTVGQQGVFGFRDDRPARFDTFAVLVNSARGRNVKEVELLAGDEGPTGQFRAITTCTFENAKMLRTPYQECKFAPVTARFLKVKIASNYGDSSYFSLEEWQLFGELGDSALASKPVVQALAPPSAAAQPSAARINLIAEKNGGALLIIPNASWKAANDDNEAPASPGNLSIGQQGVFGFRDDRPAKFDTFAVLVNSARGRNVKEVELLVGDEGPTGQFRAIATCAFENAKMLRTPYQECKFAPVTARFLKVKVNSNYGDRSYFTIEEWQLLGQLEP